MLTPITFRVISSILLALYLFPFATAQIQQDTLVLEAIPVAPQAEVGGTARFIVAVTNAGEERDVFKISGDPYDVGAFSKFAKSVKINPNQIKLGPGERREVDVEISIHESATPNEEFIVDVDAISLSHPATKESITLKASVVPKNEVVQIVLDAPGDARAGDEISFSILFKNRVNMPLTNFEVSVYSDLPDISRSFFINFTQQQEHSLDFTFPLALSAAPGHYALNVRVYDGTDLKGSFVSAFSVLERPAVEEKTAEKGGFLKSEITIMKINEGNVKSSQIIEVSSNFLNNLFLTTQPEAETKRGNLMWSFSLEPGEEYTATITKNYRPLFYGFLAIVLAVALIYFYIERSVVIKKRIFMLKSAVDGISEMKILLIIRNGKKIPLHDVKVMDMLPDLIQPTHEFGTLKPDRVQQGARGKRFIWELGTLQPGEERVLTYRVRAKMHLAGGATLPAALLQYQRGDSFRSIASHRLDIVTRSDGAENQ